MRPAVIRTLAILALPPLSACAATANSTEPAPPPAKETPAAPTPDQPKPVPAPSGAATASATPPAPGDQVAPPPPTETPAARAERLLLDRIALEKARIETEAEIAALKTRRARADADAERMRLDADAALRSARLALELADTDEARAAFDRASAIANLKNSIASFDAGADARDLETDARIKKLELDNALARINAQTSRIKRDQEASRIIASASRAHPAEPLAADGTLTVSDRRIALNGVISDAAARHVIERLNFYNIRDPKAPVFIVMDNSLGGSIMAGYQIIRAIDSSRAPVHVVVKGAAESMAAAIVACAPRSYVFASSVILHRQAEGFASGNLTVMRERRTQLEEFFRRVNEPVARRMGVSVEEFVKLMYRNNSDGAWIVFGEEAVKLRWADKIITRIVEDGVDDMVASPGSGRAYFFGEYKDAEGRTRIELPPLAPGDAWMIHDPQGLYRAR